jgi:hypothetical protein
MATTAQSSSLHKIWCHFWLFKFPFPSRPLKFCLFHLLSSLSHFLITYVNHFISLLTSLHLVLSSSNPVSTQLSQCRQRSQFLNTSLLLLPPRIRYLLTPMILFCSLLTTTQCSCTECWALEFGKRRSGIAVYACGVGGRKWQGVML